MPLERIDTLLKGTIRKMTSSNIVLDPPPNGRSCDTPQNENIPWVRPRDPPSVATSNSCRFGWREPKGFTPTIPPGRQNMTQGAKSGSWDPGRYQTCYSLLSHFRRNFFVKLCGAPLGPQDFVPALGLSKFFCQVSPAENGRQSTQFGVKPPKVGIQEWCSGSELVVQGLEFNGQGFKSSRFGSRGFGVCSVFEGCFGVFREGGGP